MRRQLLLYCLLLCPLWVAGQSVGDVFEEDHVEYRVISIAPPKAEVKKTTINAPVTLRASVTHEGVAYSVVYPDEALEAPYDLYLVLDEPLEGLTLERLMKSGDKLYWLQTNFPLIPTADALKTLNANTPKLFKLTMAQLPEGVIERDGSFYSADGLELLRYQNSDRIAILPYHLKRIAAYAFPTRTDSHIIALPRGLEEIILPQRDAFEGTYNTMSLFHTKTVLGYTGMSTGKAQLHARFDAAYPGAATAKIPLGITQTSTSRQKVEDLIDTRFFSVTTSASILGSKVTLTLASQGEGTLYAEEYLDGERHSYRDRVVGPGSSTVFYPNIQGGSAFNIKESATSKTRCAGFVYYKDTVRTNALELAIWEKQDKATVVWCNKGEYLEEFDYRLSPDGTTLTRFWHHTDTSLTLPAIGAATRLGQAFLRCPKEVEELTIPLCYKELAPHALAACPSIKRLALEKGDVGLAPGALSDCRALEVVYIADEQPPSPQSFKDAFSPEGLPKGLSIWVPAEKATQRWKDLKSSFSCPVFFVPKQITITNSKETNVSMSVRWHPQDDTTHQVAHGEKVTLPRFARYTVDFHNSPRYDFMEQCDSADSPREFKYYQEHIAYQDLTLTPHAQLATYAIVYSEPTGGQIVVTDATGTVRRSGERLPRGTQVTCKASLTPGNGLEHFLVNGVDCPLLDTTLTLHRELNLSLTTKPKVITPIRWTVRNLQPDPYAPKKSPILIAGHEGSYEFTVADGEVIHIEAQTQPDMRLAYILLNYEDGRTVQYASNGVDVAITSHVSIGMVELPRYTHFKFNQAAKQRIVIIDRDLEVQYEDGDSCRYNTKLEVYHIDAKYEDLKSISLVGLERYGQKYLAARGDTAYISLEVEPMLTTLTIPPTEGCNVTLDPLPTLVDPEKGIYTMPLDTSLTIAVTPWVGWDYEHCSVPGTTGKIKPAKFTLYVQGPTQVNIAVKPRTYTAEVEKNNLPGTLSVTHNDDQTISKRTKLKHGEVITVRAKPEENARALGIVVNGKFHPTKHLEVTVDTDLQLAGVFAQGPALCPYEFCLSPQQDTLLRAWTKASVINFAAEPLSKVKVIAPYALANNPYIERVALNGQVHELADMAFQHSDNLWDVTLGPQLQCVNVQAFADLKFLRYVDLTGTADHIPQFVHGNLLSTTDTYGPLRIRVPENELGAFLASPSLVGYEVLPHRVNITVCDVPQKGAFVLTCYGDSVRTEQQLEPAQTLTLRTDGGAWFALHNQAQAKKQIDSVVVNGQVQYLPLELEACEDLTISFRHAAPSADKETAVESLLPNVKVRLAPEGLLVRNHAHSTLLYSIYSLLGHELQSGSLSAGETTINLQQLPSGLYYLRLADHATGRAATYPVVR